MNEKDYELFLKARQYIDNHEDDKGVSILEEMIKRSNRKAAYELATYYQKRNEINKAINFYILSADLGYKDSFIKLGKIFYELKNYKESYRYFMNVENKKEVYLYLGIMELEGLIKHSDKKRAFHYFLMGAKKNKEECHYYLAYCYHNGIGVKANKEKENYHLKKIHRLQIEDKYHLLSKIN